MRRPWRAAVLLLALALPATTTRAADAPGVPPASPAAVPDTLYRGHWAGPADSTLVTVLLVRHAERNTTMLGHDVPLNDVGERRARELARIAGEAGVSAIYATPTIRARDTAAPLAARLGDTLTVVHDVGETVTRLKTRHWGRTVLVVGHSNTVPQIIAGLTGRKVPEFVAEFDLLYVVTLARDGRSSIVRLHYGE